MLVFDLLLGLMGLYARKLEPKLVSTPSTIKSVELIAQEVSILRGEDINFLKF